MKTLLSMITLIAMCQCITNNASTINTKNLSNNIEKVSLSNECVEIIDESADEEFAYYGCTEVRVGAVCNDGWVSTATGSGACSWHGGVAYWLYDCI